ncbi:MAG: group I intron-associated PD-(D/E)XK endonuclease, partial [Solirubrobacteraceae bacterium]
MEEGGKRDPRGQGDQGERSAIVWLLEQGAAVFVPVGHSRDFDLIAHLDGRLLRVQVKTSTVLRNTRWDVTVCTRGGNRSWNGIIKYLDP